MTSQSRRIWRSPSATRSVTARRLRPIRRWISWVRPLCRPRAASRSVRVWVERGSMPYSAVAAHSTWVLPKRARHEPSAWRATPGSRTMARSSSAARPDGRIIPSSQQPALRLRRGRLAALSAAGGDVDPAVVEFEVEIGPGADLGRRGDDVPAGADDDIAALQHVLVPGHMAGEAAGEIVQRVAPGGERAAAGGGEARRQIAEAGAGMAELGGKRLRPQPRRRQALARGREPAGDRQAEPLDA